jgi:hypothetical protein
MSAPKTNRGAIARRVAQILPLVLDGASEREILRFVAEKTNWSHVSERTVDNYIARAREQIIAEAGKDAELHFAKAMARYERLFWRASLKGDLGQCRLIQEAINKLLGLAAPERHEISGPQGIPLTVPADTYDLTKLKFEELELLRGLLVKAQPTPRQCTCGALQISDGVGATSA